MEKIKLFIVENEAVEAMAMSDESSFNRARVTEPYGYFVKPFSERDLYTTIETSLHRNWIDRRLIECETKYRALFEKSRDAIFISAADRTMTDVNPAMKEMAGYDMDRLQGNSRSGAASPAASHAAQRSLYSMKRYRLIFTA